MPIRRDRSLSGTNCAAPTNRRSELLFVPSARFAPPAKRDGMEWVFIDTPPNVSSVVDDAIRNATMVIIPARPGVFDVNAVQETIQTCRSARKPYAVVINGAPAQRDGIESPIVTIARETLTNSARRSGAARSPTAPIC